MAAAHYLFIGFLCVFCDFGRLQGVTLITNSGLNDGLPWWKDPNSLVPNQIMPGQLVYRIDSTTSTTVETTSPAIETTSTSMKKTSSKVKTTVTTTVPPTTSTPYLSTTTSVAPAEALKPNEVMPTPFVIGTTVRPIDSTTSTTVAPIETTAAIIGTTWPVIETTTTSAKKTTTVKAKSTSTTVSTTPTPILPTTTFVPPAKALKPNEIMPTPFAYRTTVRPIDSTTSTTVAPVETTSAKVETTSPPTETTTTTSPIKTTTVKAKSTSTTVPTTRTPTTSTTTTVAPVETTSVDTVETTSTAIETTSTAIETTSTAIETTSTAIETSSTTAPSTSTTTIAPATTAAPIPQYLSPLNITFDNTTSDLHWVAPAASADTNLTYAVYFGRSVDDLQEPQGLTNGTSYKLHNLQRCTNYTALVKIVNTTSVPSHEDYFNFTTPFNRRDAPPDVRIQFDSVTHSLNVSWQQSYFCERAVGPPAHPTQYAVNVTDMSTFTTGTKIVNATDTEWLSLNWPNFTVDGEKYIIGIISNEPNALAVHVSGMAPLPPAPPAASTGHGWFIAFGIAILIGAALCMALKWQQRRQNGDSSEYASLIDPSVA